MINSVYRTKDFNYASVLLFKKFQLIRTEWEGNSAYWVFSDEDKMAERTIASFVNSEMEGNISAFLNAQRTIKTSIH